MTASECLEWLLAADGAPCWPPMIHSNVSLLQMVLANGNSYREIQILVAAGWPYKCPGLAQIVCERRQNEDSDGNGDECSVFDLLECLDATDDPSAFAWFAECRAEIDRKRSVLAHLAFANIKRRAIAICIALQPLALPALLTLAVVDTACDPCGRVPMHLKWRLITLVKHAHVNEV